MEAPQIATRTLLIALVVVSAAVSGMARTSSSDDSSLCGMSQAELFECKPAAVAGAAVPPPPSAACCTALAHANVTCFCTFKNNKYLSLFGINSTRAMQLPTMCDPTQVAHC